MRNIIFLTLLSFLITTSCTKEVNNIEATNATHQVEIKESGKFAKEFIITDESGLNSMQVDISSDTEAIIDMYTEDNFMIKPIFTEFLNTGELNTTEEDHSEIDDWKDDEHTIYVKYSNVELEEGTTGFTTQVKDPEYNSKVAGWQTPDYRYWTDDDVKGVIVEKRDHTGNELLVRVGVLWKPKSWLYKRQSNAKIYNFGDESGWVSCNEFYKLRLKQKTSGSGIISQNHWALGASDCD